MQSLKLHQLQVLVSILLHTQVMRVALQVNIYGYGWGISAWNGTNGTLIQDALNGADNGSGTITVDDGSKFEAEDFILVADTISATANSGSGGATSTHGVSPSAGGSGGVNSSNKPAEVMKVTNVSSNTLTVI